MKEIYLLDRNVVDVIKNSIVGKKVCSDKLPMLKRLKTLDNPNSIISPILSIIEGQTSKVENSKEVLKTLEKESEIIARFFNLAKVDTSYLIDNKHKFCNVFCDYTSNVMDEHSEFLEKVSSLIYQSGKDKTKVKNEIIKLALDQKLNLNHYVVVSCLACLYGSRFARKVLKPKRNGINTYNALSDLSIISKICQMKASLVKSNLNARIELLTLDQGLKNLLSNVVISEALWLEDGSLKVSLAYEYCLFPDLPHNKYLKLMKEIGGK